MKTNLIPLSRIILFSSFLFLLSCQNSEPTTAEKDFKDAKDKLEEEFTKEMTEQGNHEISIDDIENDLNKMDQELENIMLEMENEMDTDSNDVESEITDTIA